MGALRFKEKELERLEVLRSYEILDSLPEQAYNDIVALASTICGTPICAIGFIDSERNWFKAKIGMDAPEISRDVAFCSQVIEGTNTIVVEDTTKDERFKNNPLVKDGLKIQFYTGTPLITHDGHRLGALCVVDRIPRKISAEQVSALEALARQVVSQLELRKIHISEKKKHAELSKQYLQYHLVINNLKEAIFQTDQNGLWTFLSPAWEELTGYKAEECLGKLFLNYVHPEDRDGNIKKFEPLINREKEFCRHQVRYVKKNGESVWIEVFARLTLDGNNQIMGTTGSLSDITEKKSAEVELSFAHERIKSTLNACLDAVITMDSNGHIQEWNDQAEVMTGWKRNSVIGLPLFNILFPSDHQSRYREGLEKFLRNGTSNFLNRRVEVVAIRDDLTEFPVELSAVPIRTTSGIMFHIFVRDLSEIKRNQIEIEEQKVKLLNSAKMSSLGEMASGIAHEINNPLAIIKGHIQLLKRKATSNSLDESTLLGISEKIEATTNRIAKIISGLRNFARDGENDPFQEVLLSKIMDDTLELCKNRFANNEIKLIVKIENPDQLFFCQPTQISQVLLNLLNNAYDATEGSKDPWVQIETKASDSNLVITVTDSGPGVPQNIRNKIMQPFFTTKAVGKGTGLGLSLSKGIIESHKGTLALVDNSTLTTFIITIPLKLKK